MGRKIRRKLAAILAADVVGYSRLMGVDEPGTLAALRAHRMEVIEPAVAAHDGRIVKLMGDGLLIEFPSAVEAVTCAVELQVRMRQRNAAIGEESRIVFRVGINIGDVILEDDDIFGDGVNVAARLEPLADPGGICVARSVRDQVRDKLDLGFEDRGEVAIRNIGRPVRVFGVVLDDRAETLATPSAAVRQPDPRRRLLLAAGLVFCLIATAALAWWLLSARPVTSAGEVLTASEKPSIAVMPFENLSDESEQAYFADGLTDDLITELSKISGLLVIARDSVFDHNGRERDIRDTARDLRAGYVLKGSVRRGGDAVRINVRLIDGRTGNHLWAERYDRQFADIFTIQDQVIGSIVSALSVQLTDTERSDLARLPTESLEAYDYYLRGEKLAYRVEPGSTEKALRAYENAIRLDPDFADAYAGYARVAVDVLSYGFADSLPSAVARKRAYEAASRAIALNPRSARSYSVLALLQMLEGEHESAIASAARAVEIGPGSAEAHLNLALVLVHAGQPEKALAAMETVLRLNPKPPGYVHDYHGLVLFMNHRDSEALAALQRDANVRTSDLGLELLASVNARMGRMEDARSALGDLLVRWPDQCLAFYQVMFAHYAREEDRAERLEALRVAGLPEWPFGFEGSPAQQITGEGLDALISDRTWSGERLGFGAFVQFVQKNGSFIERGPDYQLSGIIWRDGDLVCMQSAAILLGRQHCGPVFRNPSGAEATRDEYVYANAYRLKRFSLMQ